MIEVGTRFRFNQTGAYGTVSKIYLDYNSLENGWMTYVEMEVENHPTETSTKIHLPNLANYIDKALQK